MAISSKFCILLLFLAYGHIAVYGQSGFISIDSGKPGNYSYYDNVTGLLYTSDEDYIDYDTVGEVHNVSPEYQGSSPHSHSDDLRSFPNSNRNCYTLKPLLPGTRYLVRAFFLYGNYDGLNRPPKFDIYIDIHFWDTIQISSASVYQHSEILVVATGESMLLCLTNTGSGTPFVSAIDVRPLDKEMYLEANTSQSLVTAYRLDFGGDYKMPLRYRNDTYDRLWTAYNQPEWTIISTTSRIDISVDVHPPQVVMSTAVIPMNNYSININLRTRKSSTPVKYYLFFYSAEIQVAANTQSRLIDIYVNDGAWYLNATNAIYLATYVFYSREPASYDGLNISFLKALGSDLPPISNGLEINVVRPITGIGTYSGDVDAVMQIKESYMVQKNWMGDPCSPKDFIWVGLRCVYAQKKSPRIVSLTLAFSGLTGNILPCFEQLTEIQYLDLSSNKLTGQIPVFLGNLPNLVFLNLSGNSLSGVVPKSLTVKAESGRLTLSVDERNQIPKINPSPSGSSEEKRKRLGVILSISICSAVALLVIGSSAVWCFRRRKRVSEKEIQGPTNNELRLTSFHTNHRKFTYNDLVAATGNFRVMIGKGGFGDVYRGTLRDSTAVAVKMLLQHSSQGFKQFQTEASLMSNIHHRNLVTLVGHCNDVNHLALVYDYMANGSLADHLGDPKRAEILRWNDRLRMSFEAAQGLAYLHDGCQPAILHRDVKSSNILLDHNLEIKIGDFGLSRIFESNTFTSVITDVVGTAGYLDPEYFETYKLTKKSDVYSFGVVLLELITGLPAMVGGVKLVNRVRPMIESGDLTGVVDQNLRGYSSNSIWKVIEIAMSCTLANSVDRPSMAEVVVMLRDCLNLEDSHVQRSHGSKPSSDGTSDSSAFMFHSNIDSTFSPGSR